MLDVIITSPKSTLPMMVLATSCELMKDEHLIRDTLTEMKAEKTLKMLKMLQRYCITFARVHMPCEVKIPSVELPLNGHIPFFVLPRCNICIISKLLLLHAVPPAFTTSAAPSWLSCSF